jgi:hypothetical protein
LNKNQTKLLFPLVKPAIEEILMKFSSFRYFSDPLKTAILELKSANGPILFLVSVYGKQNLTKQLFPSMNFKNGDYNCF